LPILTTWRKLLPKWGGGNFQEEFNQIQKYFEEGAVLESEVEMLFGNMKEVINNFSIYVYSNLENPEIWEEKIEKLINTLAELLLPLVSKNEQLRTLALKLDEIYGELDVKTDGYISEFRERFGSQYGPINADKRKEINAILKKQAEVNAFYYSIATAFYYSGIDALKDFDALKILHDIKKSGPLQRIRELEQVERYKVNDFSIELKHITHEKNIEIIMLRGQIDDMERAHARELRGLMERHNDKLFDIQREYASEKDGLLATIESLKEKIAEQEKEFEAKIEELTNKMDEQKESFEKEISSLRRKISNLRAMNLFLAGIIVSIGLTIVGPMAIDYWQERSSQPTIEEQSDFYENPTTISPTEYQIEYQSNDEFYYGQYDEYAQYETKDKEQQDLHKDENLNGQ